MSDSLWVAWTVSYQVPPSMEFSRQDHWNGLPFPSPGNLPDPGIEPGSFTLWADALLSEASGNLVLKGILNKLFAKNFQVI